MIKDSLIPKKMSPGEWMDSIQDAFGIYANNDMRRRGCDRSERIRKGRMFRESVQAYLERPQKRFQKKIEAFMKSSDFPEMVSNVFDTFKDTTNYDMGWDVCFKDASNRIEPGTNFWEILTLTEGPTWYLVPEGHSVKLDERTGSKVTVEAHKYGAGIGWTDEMIRFRKIGPLLDMAEDFKDGYYRKRTDDHYGLLADAAKDDIDIYPQSGGNMLENDILALNNTAYNILLNLKDTRNVTDATQLILYINPRAKSRILRALGEVSQAYSGSQQRVVYNITPVFTFNSNLPSALSGDTYGAMLVAPGMKIQSATVMEPTFFNDEDILTFSKITTGFAYYGACVADANQARQMSFG